MSVEIEWSLTLLGPRDAWPPNLEYAVRQCLDARQPTCLYWGSDLVRVENDAMLALVGHRDASEQITSAPEAHPASPSALRALTGKDGESILVEDVAFAIGGASDNRAYFTFAYAPIGRPPNIAGILCTAFETTERVRRERASHDVENGVAPLVDADHRDGSLESADSIDTRFARKTKALIDFQRAAMPQHLPTVPGLRFSAVYESAQADALVGGDWYDAFPLSDGRIVLSVGDVSGSGLQAAVTMGAVRQTIRGALQLYPDPVAVLDAADRALRLEQPDRIVTAFVGILDPTTRGFSYASAGHPPPLVRAADGTIRELVATDLPLGLRDFGSSSDGGWTVLPEDGLLVLHTDGLTESTRNILEGNRLLGAALATDAVYRAADPAKVVRDAVIDGASSDDVAILVLRLDSANVRRGGRLWSFHGADATQATLVRREVAAAVVQGADDDERADAELIVGELIGNVVRHANGMIKVSLEMTADGPVLHVFDRGPGFTFGTRLPSDALSESGRGLYIVACIARELTVMPRWDGGSHARVLFKTQSIA